MGATASEWGRAGMMGHGLQGHCRKILLHVCLAGHDTVILAEATATPPPHPLPQFTGRRLRLATPDSNNPHDSSPVCAVLPQTRYKGEAVAGGLMVPVNTVVNFV